MPGRIKSLLSERVIEHLRKSGLNHPQASIAPFIQIGAYKNNCIELQIPLNKLQHQNFDNFAKTDLFYDVHINTQVKYPYVCFKTSTKDFIKHTLNLQSQLYLRRPKTGIKTLVEFSSPNIAKPFHVGHLRSTIIGSFIANLKSFLGHDVIRLNYLGDWGTQFGFLKLGVDLLNINDDEMRKSPIELLYKAYVHANKLAQEDSTISDRAREVFARLEQGGAEDMEKWHLYRTYTVDELIQVYKRLNVEFQEYHWESMYDRKSIHNIIKLLETKNILKTSPDGKKYIELFNRNVTVIKSDGSSLYLSRDIAAALDRHTKYNFDNMYYIVDNAQTDHFVALFETLKQVDASLYEKCKHVKFGRIRGMSTRKGDVVFLSDILDEAKDVMYRRQLESPTTKTAQTDHRTPDILGTTAVIINDLKQRRTRDYRFEWTNALHMQGDSGIRLQHTHCRLHNLELNSGARLAHECDEGALLKRPEAVQLVVDIARFEDALVKADRELEACVVVNYLFGLCNSINKALKTLQVKNQGELGNQRLLMFHCAKRVLNQGMRILGLQPLEKM